MRLLLNNGQKKKISTQLPRKLLEEAVALTGLNQTDALTLGLQEIVARVKRRSFLDLKGKIKLKLNLDNSRERKPF